MTPRLHPEECKFDDCEKPVTNRGWCQMHYTRWRRHGDPGFTLMPGKPRIGTSGYVLVAAHGHVLANSNNLGYVHRLNLFDAIGYGPHRCHWCGACVAWKAPRLSPACLVVDHIDGDRENNDPTNLVPSCHYCNLTRVPRPKKTHCAHGHEYTQENTYIDPTSGKRHCKTCVADNGRRYRARKKAAA